MIKTAADPMRRGRRAAAATPGAYTMTQPEDWTMINAANPRRPIELVPYTGGNEFYGVNMTYAEMVRMKDENGNIRYNKVFEWMLPMFARETFWDFLAARMRSYMTNLMMQGWKPRWYDPDKGCVILTDHVARMFGCQQCRGIRGFPSVNDSWSTRCSIGAVAPLKECMLHDAFTNLYWCLHFADDFGDDEEWGDIYFDEKHVSPEMASHRQSMVR